VPSGSSSSSRRTENGLSGANDRPAGTVRRHRRHASSSNHILVPALPRILDLNPQLRIELVGTAGI